MSAVTLAVAASVSGCTGLIGDESESENNGSTSGESTKGAELRLRGQTAEDVTVEEPQNVEKTIAENLDVDPRAVRARRDENAVELLTQESNQTEFVDALSVAGLEVTDDAVRAGVTEQTRKKTIEVLETRLKETEYTDASVTAVGPVAETPHIRFHVPDASESDVLDEIRTRGTVEIVAGYPRETDDGTELITEQVLTNGDFSRVGTPEPAARGRAPHVPVTLTDEAAKRLSEKMKSAGFTNAGVGRCSFDAEQDDSPKAEEWCLYTVVDGEYLYGASMSQSLAETFNSGNFRADPRFVLTTQSMEKAKEVAMYLRTGSLPAPIEIME